MLKDRIKDSGVFMNRNYLMNLIGICILCFWITFVVAIWIIADVSDSNSMTINGETYSIVKDSLLSIMILFSFVSCGIFAFIALYVYNYYDKSKSFDENNISAETAIMRNSNDHNVKYVAFVNPLLTCPQCGKQIKDDPKFCPECGNKIK